MNISILSSKPGVDTLILGCTHYPPLMADVLQDVVGNDVTLISSAEEIARGGAKELFTSQNLLTPLLKKAPIAFCQLVTLPILRK